MLPKLVRVTTIPLSLEKLLEGQLTFMSRHYNVTAISAGKERLEQYAKENNVNFFYVEMTRAITPLRDTKAFFRLYKFLKQNKPLIVHTHTPKAGIVGMLAAKLAGVPIRLHTVAGLPLMETTGGKRRLLNVVERITYSLTTRIYPNSVGLKEVILKKGFATESKMKVLGKGSSNGIDTSYFDSNLFKEEDKQHLKKELGIKDGELIFIFIGRLVSEKGINELVGAFEKLNSEIHDTRLLLVGPYEHELDPLLPETMKIIGEHPNIITTGYQQDVRQYLAVSDVLTFPSYREGFPNVVMQAGSMGIPSIVTNINGCNEIVKNGENGVIIPVKNETSLMNSMNLLAKDIDLRKKLSGNSRKMICENYERTEFWQILLKEYKTLQKQCSKA